MSGLREGPIIDQPAAIQPGRGAEESAAPALRVDDPGLLATIQDLGRPGLASLGIARSGALDRTALRTAHRLMGNAEHAAAIEVTMGGFRATALRDLWVTVTGAWGPITLDDRAIDPYEAHPWPAGQALLIDWFAHGSRAYLALRGGIDVPRVVGSRACDLLAGLGSPALRQGDLLALAEDLAGPIPASLLSPWGAPADGDLRIELAPGPRADWFAASALPLLFDSVWTVTDKADRVGLRLHGPVLERVRTAELPSEGMVPGALQIPPSGMPTVLLADGPVTGGYPVIAVVTDASLDAIAQARPGTRVRFAHSHEG